MINIIRKYFVIKPNAVLTQLGFNYGAEVPEDIANCIKHDGYLRCETYLENSPFLKQDFALVNSYVLPDKLKSRNSYTLVRIVDWHVKCDTIIFHVNVWGDPEYIRSSEVIYVELKYLHPTQVYYFVNSKGAICVDHTGHNPEADKWRRASGNFFLTKDNVKEYRNKILSQTC